MTASSMLVYAGGAAAPPPTVTSVSPSTVSANGTAVTITGTGFTEDATLDAILGYGWTNVEVVSDTTITATTPAIPSGDLPGDPSLLDVTVTQAGGSDTLEEALSIAAAGFDSISPTSGLHGGGMPYAIVGWGFSQYTASGVSIGSGSDHDIDVVDDTHITGTVPASETTGAATVQIDFDSHGSVTKASAFTYT